MKFKDSYDSTNHIIEFFKFPCSPSKILQRWFKPISSSSTSIMHVTGSISLRRYYVTLHNVSPKMFIIEKISCAREFSLRLFVYIGEFLPRSRPTLPLSTLYATRDHFYAARVIPGSHLRFELVREFRLRAK